MKTLRKSLNGSKDAPRLQISTPLPLPAVSRPPLAILPPQKVIRALASHRSQAPQELSFQKGDFFYVTNDNEDRGPWYEAHNPITGARGLVPRQMFEEFKRTASSQQSASDSAVHQTIPGRLPIAKHPVYYAVVQHDFEAERQDELDAKRGDTVTVVAQSNREWFVAKPIGRLGRPGLIPVSFVEIHDPVTGKVITDIDGLIDRGELPKVEDWKKAMLNYKQNSIPLGVIDTPAKSPGPNSVPPTPLRHQSTPSMSNLTGNHPFSYHDPVQPAAPEPLPEGLLLSADVVSFHYEMHEYWFRIDALFQPYQKPGESHLPPAKQLILFRVYNDFYEFQVNLLDAFPREGGRHPPHPRILPFMPGPAENVDDALTATRRAELDTYVHGLCDLSHAGYRYILEHRTVREFLSLKPGDVDNDVDPRSEEIQAILDNELRLQQGDSLMDGNYEQEMGDRLSRLRVEDDRSDGSEYLDDRYNSSSMSQTYDGERQSYALSNDTGFRTVQTPYGQAHERTSSSSSFHSRTQSPYPDHHSTQPLRNGGHSQSHVRQESGYYQNGGASTTSLRSSSQNASQSRPPSGAAKNLNTPPISAANPQTAFVKIKIFTRGAEDLIAIRVHPKVTHLELMEKVQGRLGEEVMALRYRDSVTEAFVGLESDSELRAWMERTDKHVLYAA